MLLGSLLSLGRQAGLFGRVAGGMAAQPPAASAPYGGQQTFGRRRQNPFQNYFQSPFGQYEEQSPYGQYGMGNPAPPPSVLYGGRGFSYSMNSQPYDASVGGWRGSPQGYEPQFQSQPPQQPSPSYPPQPQPQYWGQPQPQYRWWQEQYQPQPYWFGWSPYRSPNQWQMSGAYGFGGVVPQPTSYYANRYRWW